MPLQPETREFPKPAPLTTTPALVLIQAMKKATVKSVPVRWGTEVRRVAWVNFIVVNG
jgi:hypothetical protein